MRFNPLHNILLKVSALALALLLWVHVATNKAYEYQIDLPLQIVNIPRGLILISDPPTEVTVKVKATGKHLLSLAARSPIVTVNAADYKAGTYEKSLNNGEILEALGEAFENIEVSFPKSFPLRFEKQTERRIAIRSAIKAETARGFILVSDPQVEPETLEISGPTSVLHQMKSLDTEPDELSGLTETTRHLTRVALPDSLHLTLKDSLVTVIVEVEPTREKSFSNIIIKSPPNFSDSRYSVIPSRVSLVLEIPQSKFDAITDADIAVSFKRPRVMGDSVKAEIEYRLPNYVAITGDHPDSVLIIRKS